jgi:hypothetical protein
MDIFKTDFILHVMPCIVSPMPRQPLNVRPWEIQVLDRKICIVQFSPASILFVLSCPDILLGVLLLKCVSHVCSFTIHVFCVCHCNTSRALAASFF